jgi:hypothetical protein
MLSAEPIRSKMTTFVAVPIQPKLSRRERANISQKAYRKSHPDTIRVSDRKAWLRRSYGLSIAEYNTMFAERNGLCDICHKAEVAFNENGVPRSLSVDHNHVTGKVRGLLCHNCNRKLGWYEREMFGINSYLVRNV